MLLTKPLSIHFDNSKFKQFVATAKKINNTNILTLMKDYDKTTGIQCNKCCKVLPLYCYNQKSSTTNGIDTKYCKECHNSRKIELLSHYKKLYNSIYRRCIKKFGIEPDFDCEYLINYMKVLDKRCAISGEIMNEEYGTGNPYNMSVERINNDLPYFKNNITFICVWLQIGYGYNLILNETRSLIYYNSENDGFVFDKDTFLNDVKAHEKQYTKYNKLQCKRDRNGNIVSKICTSCNTSKSISEYNRYTRSKNNKETIESECRECALKRRKETFNTVRGFIFKMVATAKRSAKRRGNNVLRNDNSSDISPDLFDIIVECIVKQNGRCALTGMPLKFIMNLINTASLDRIDNSKGYVRGNIQIIIAPINTYLKPSNDDFFMIRENHMQLTK